jgi:hypothetical protein
VSSLPGYEVGSALSVLPNVTQNRSCHEKGRSARIYVIIRDGTSIGPTTGASHSSEPEITHKLTARSSDIGSARPKCLTGEQNGINFRK